jgi:hypothetical protein
MKGKLKMPCDGRCGFSRVFSRWLQENPVSIKVVAAEIGVASSTICQWRDGTRCPSLDYLKLSCEYTGIPLCRLICDRRDCNHCTGRNDRGAV